MGLIQSATVLIKFGPDVVIGLGGYSAGPVVVAAWLLRIPRVIQEQNVIPGITNRLLARFADLIFTSFPDTAIAAPIEKICFTGNPVRDEIIKAFDASASEKNRRFTVLILGGSQGARGLNRLVIAALDHLKETDRFRFIHQTGPADLQDAAIAYAEKDIANTTAPFFTDMAALYARADLVICRAGATTVAEIIAAGKPAVFIPFPHATDNHQVYNAQGTGRPGGGRNVSGKRDDRIGPGGKDRLLCGSSRRTPGKTRKYQTSPGGRCGRADRFAHQPAHRPGHRGQKRFTRVKRNIA